MNKHLQSGRTFALSKIATGKDHACVLAADGGVKCWGREADGRLGNDQSGNSYHGYPVDVVADGTGSLLGDIVQVSSSGKGTHTCAVTSQGRVKCWGNGDEGKLGLRNASDKSIPQNVRASGSGNSLLSDIIQVATGNNHTCALTSRGEVKCWGDGDGGRLGNRNSTDVYYPVSVYAGSSGSSLLSDIVQISVGGEHTCALTSGGEVKCWGKGGYGRLGDQYTTNRSTPVSVKTASSGSSLLSNIVAISAGGHFTCALTSGGEVRCWGRQNHGQLGNGTIANTNKTYAVSVVASASDTGNNLSGIVNIVAGPYHSCAVTSEGEAKCWGAGGNGRSGLNNGAQTVAYPTLAAMGPSNTALSGSIIELALGDEYGCVLTSEGRMRCWGGGSYGRLGNDDGTGVRSLPVGVVAADNSSDLLIAGTYQRERRCLFGGLCFVGQVVLSTTTASPNTAVSIDVTASGATANQTVSIYSDAACSSQVGSNLDDGEAVTASSLAVNQDHHFYFKVNEGGNSSHCSKSSLLYVVDTAAPTAPTVELVTSSGSDDTPDIRISSIVLGDLIEIYTDGACTGDAAAPDQYSNDASGTMDVTVSALASAGTYQFYAKAIDLASNESDCSAASADYVYSTGGVF